MLLVKTYVGKSKIHGIGLFSDQFIPKGTVVWEFNLVIDKVISKDELDGLKQIVQEDIFKNLKAHIPRLSQDLFMICGDDAKFINHSDKANLLDVSIYTSVANKDIKKGEEITENYTTTYFDENDIGFLKEVKK